MQTNPLRFSHKKDGNLSGPHPTVFCAFIGAQQWCEHHPQDLSEESSCLL